ncbi:MAG TPA: hypothetical protein DIW31_08990 [Bacteroidales bacterium]|nr:hypothetical protein [Bacteroidales bacterium]
MFRAIGNQFRKPSGFLGRIISSLMIKGNNYAYEKTIIDLDIKQNDRLYEIGYGHGLGVFKILSNYNCYVSGIDFSELMFKEASKRNSKYIESKRSELTFGDFLTTELPSNLYDKIFCLNVIYFWDNLEVPFAKIRNTLKDGGIFYFFMADRDDLNRLKFTKDDIFNKYSIEQVITSLNNAGFKNITYNSDKGYKKERGYYVKCFK